MTDRPLKRAVVNDPLFLPIYKGPWCCERGQLLRVRVCPACDETERAYQNEGREVLDYDPDHEEDTD